MFHRNYVPWSPKYVESRLFLFVFLRLWEPQTTANLLVIHQQHRHLYRWIYPRRGKTHKYRFRKTERAPRTMERLQKIDAEGIRRGQNRLCNPENSKIDISEENKRLNGKRFTYIRFLKSNNVASCLDFPPIVRKGLYQSEFMASGRRKCTGVLARFRRQPGLKAADSQIATASLGTTPKQE